MSDSGVLPSSPQTSMGRLLDMADASVDELREVFRKHRSVFAVIQRIRERRLGRGHGDYDLILLETFRLGVGQMTWFIWWDDDPVPGQACITDQELDEKMVPEVEARRQIWDRPASEDDPDFWDKPATAQSNAKSAALGANRP